MKKFLTLILVVVLTISLVACSGNGSTRPSTEIPETDVDVANEQPKEMPVEQEQPAEQESSEEATDSSEELSTDFKQAMDDYEDFIDDYVDIMKKYQENPTDPTILSDYMTIVADYSDIAEDFESWDSSTMTDDEWDYYIEVQTRTSEKLLEMTQ